MLSPRMAKVMLNKYRKENPVQLEPKYGWGHEAWIKDLANTIEKMEFAPEWRPTEVRDYIAKFVRSCGHSNASSVSHERGGHGWD
jgi:N-acetylglucosamine-6-phosphate deacetylase